MTSSRNSDIDSTMAGKFPNHKDHRIGTLISLPVVNSASNAATALAFILALYNCTDPGVLACRSPYGRIVRHSRMILLPSKSHRGHFSRIVFMVGAMPMYLYLSGGSVGFRLMFPPIKKGCGNNNY